jgi:tRNA A22 N-methylase
MDYSRIYNELINNAKDRDLTCYAEKHHIIPRCLGGNDSLDNLVNLTAREHFIAHLLLCKIYPNHKGLRLALWMMSNVKDKNQERYTPNSRLYEIIRLEYSKSVSDKNNPNFGNKYSKETKQILSRKAKERVGIRNSFYGKKHSEETRGIISKSLSGNKHSEETKQKMSNAHSGKKKNLKIVVCPYCNREGSGPNMSRYHFNNCKNK